MNKTTLTLAETDSMRERARYRLRKFRKKAVLCHFSGLTPCKTLREVRSFTPTP